MQSEDVNLKGIVGFLGIIAVLLTLVYGVLTTMWRHLEDNARRADQQALEQASFAAGQPYFPYPREQPNPVADLNKARAREEAELNSYAWIDKTNRVVRIPVDRAMEIIIQQGEKNP